MVNKEMLLEDKQISVRRRRARPSAICLKDKALPSSSSYRRKADLPVKSFELSSMLFNQFLGCVPRFDNGPNRGRLPFCFLPFWGRGPDLPGTKINTIEIANSGPYSVAKRSFGVVPISLYASRFDVEFELALDSTSRDRPLKKLCQFRLMCAMRHHGPAQR